jgi:dienelactone hydrolase
MWNAAGRAVAGLLALAALLFGIWQLEQARAGLTVQRERVGSMPVTVFRPAAPPAGGNAAPLVVIAHGFAGSQQLMQPLALTLARNGYIAVTFDFPGHGRNPAPMSGGLADQDESLRVLLAALERVTDWARTWTAPGAGYAVLGHSMASDIVVRHAQAHGEVPAVVALSLFAPTIGSDTPPDSPRNLLVVDGAWEPRALRDEALRVIGRVAGAGAQERVTYGRFEDGTARRAAFAAGVEHISVLYSAQTAAETVAWLDRAYGRPPSPSPFVAAYGPALAALLAGLLGLAWLLARALPRVAHRDAARGLAFMTPRSQPWGWRGFWPLAVLPALATPLLLWKLPSDVLPILLGDYLMLHFGFYGLLTAAGLWWRGRPGLPPPRLGALIAASVLVTIFGLLAVGIPVDRFLFNLSPAPVRWPMILALALGTVPWFLADELLTRSPRAPRAAYAVTKLCFLVSLALAIALDPGRLFFLALIVPAILMLFVVYGLFSRWVFRATGHPAVAALANALVFAWFMAVTFPLVA